MVSHSLKSLRDPLKESSVVVLDMSDLSMDWFRSISDLGAVRPPDSLMSQAHTKDGDVIRLKDL